MPQYLTKLFAADGDEGELTPRRLQSASLALLGIIAVGFLLVYLDGLFKPLAMAAFLSVIVATGLAEVKRFGVPGWLALPVLGLILLIFLGFFGLIMYSQALEVTKNITKYGDKVDVMIEDFDSWLEEKFPSMAEHLSLRKMMGGGGAVTTEQEQKEMAENIQQLAFSAIGTVGHYVWQVFLILLYMAFLFAEGARFRRRVVNTYGGKHAAEIMEAVEDIAAGIREYVKVKVIVSFTVAAASAAIMWVAGLEYILLWATIIFLFNFVPYIGSIVAVMMPAALGLVVFDNTWHAVIMAAFLIAAQIAVGNLLEPKLAGKRLHLAPIIILIALVIGGTLWGIVGMFLCAPAALMLKVILERIPTTKHLAMLISDEVPAKRRLMSKETQQVLSPSFDETLTHVDVGGESQAKEAEDPSAPAGDNSSSQSTREKQVHVLTRTDVEARSVLPPSESKAGQEDPDKADGPPDAEPDDGDADDEDADAEAPDADDADASGDTDAKDGKKKNKKKGKKKKKGKGRARPRTVTTPRPSALPAQPHDDDGP